MKTGVPVAPSVCKFTKDVGRGGREENPGNNLQTISYIFRKLYPGALWRPFVAVMHGIYDPRCRAKPIMAQVECRPGIRSGPDGR